MAISSIQLLVCEQGELAAWCERLDGHGQDVRNISAGVSVRADHETLAMSHHLFGVRFKCEQCIEFCHLLAQDTCVTELTITTYLTR